MPAEIVPGGSQPPALRIPTRLNRQLSRVQEAALIRAARVAGVTYVTNAALVAAAQISVMQETLEKSFPSEGVSGRFHSIAEAGVVALQAEVLRLQTGL